MSSPWAGISAMLDTLFSAEKRASKIRHLTFLAFGSISDACNFVGSWDQTRLDHCHYLILAAYR